MRTIGFSTGALAYADFRRAVDMLRGKPVRAIELSALRECELRPMLEGLDELDLSQFEYVSVHAPSDFPKEHEAEVVNLLSAYLSAAGPSSCTPTYVTILGCGGNLAPSCASRTWTDANPGAEPCLS